MGEIQAVNFECQLLNFNFYCQLLLEHVDGSLLTDDSREDSRRRTELSAAPLVDLVGSVVHEHSSVPKTSCKQKRHTDGRTSRRRRIDNDDCEDISPRKRRLFQHAKIESQLPATEKRPGWRRSKCIMGNVVHEHGSVPNTSCKQERHIDNRTSRKGMIDDDAGGDISTKKRKLFQPGKDEPQSLMSEEWPEVRRSKRIADMAARKCNSSKELHRNASTGPGLRRKNRTAATKRDRISKAAGSRLL